MRIYSSVRSILRVALIPLLVACASTPGKRPAFEIGSDYEMRMTSPPEGASNRTLDRKTSVDFSFVLDRRGFIVDIRNASKSGVTMHWNRLRYIDPYGKEYPLIRANRVGRYAAPDESRLAPGEIVSEYLGVQGVAGVVREPDRPYPTPWVGMDPVSLCQPDRFQNPPLWEGPVAGRRIHLFFTFSHPGKIEERSFEFGLEGEEWPDQTVADAFREISETKAVSKEIVGRFMNRPEEKVHRYVHDLLQHSIDPAVRESAASLIGHWGDAKDLPFLAEMLPIENHAKVKEALKAAIEKIESYRP